MVSIFRQIIKQILLFYKMKKLDKTTKSMLYFAEFIVKMPIGGIGKNILILIEKEFFMKCQICGKKKFFTMNGYFSSYEGLLIHLIMRHPDFYDEKRKELESFRREEEVQNAEMH